MIGLITMMLILIVLFSKSPLENIGFIITTLFIFWIIIITTGGTIDPISFLIGCIKGLWWALTQGWSVW